MSIHPFANLCVFCGSKPGNSDAFRHAATALGMEMARRGIDLVYGGASVGLMGQIANTVLGHGGHATGVIPRGLFDEEVAHTGLTRLITVDSMHQRKDRMASLSDGFVAMPGGFGTFEELFEAITWSQIQIHTKPIGLLNVDGYPVLSIDRAARTVKLDVELLKIQFELSNPPMPPFDKGGIKRGLL